MAIKWIDMKKKAAGSICGGTIKESEFLRRVKNSNVAEVMMAWIMPDKWFDKYHKAMDKGKEGVAHRIFEKYARSIV
jgi:hypothetical protein